MQWLKLFGHVLGCKLKKKNRTIDYMQPESAITRVVKKEVKKKVRKLRGRCSDSDTDSDEFDDDLVSHIIIGR